MCARVDQACGIVGLPVKTAPNAVDLERGSPPVVRKYCGTCDTVAAPCKLFLGRRGQAAKAGRAHQRLNSKTTAVHAGLSTLLGGSPVLACLRACLTTMHVLVTVVVGLLHRHWIGMFRLLRASTS